MLFTLLFFSIYSSTSGIGLASALILLSAIWSYRSELRKVTKFPLYYFLVFFTLVVLISFFMNEPYESEKPMGKLRYYWLYLALLIALIRKPNLIDRLDRIAVPLAITLGVIAVFQSVFGLFAFKFLGTWDLAIVPHSTGYFRHARGFVYHHVPFAYNAVLLYHWLLSPVLVGAQKRTPARIAAISLIAIAVLLSFSRGAWLAFVVSNLMVAITLFGKRSLKYLAAAAVIVGAVIAVTPGLRDRALSFRPEQNSERIILWRISSRMFLDSPLYGQGFHSFQTRRHVFGTPEEKNSEHFPVDPHSMYFDILGGVGILGALAFFGLILTAFVNYFRALAQTVSPIWRGRLGAGLGCLTAFCVAGLSDSHNVITYTLVGTIFYLALGQFAVINATRHQL